MSDIRDTHHNSRAAEAPGLSFRHFQGEADYPLMLAIFMESTRADQMHESISLENIQSWCAPSKRFDPFLNISLAVGHKPGGEDRVVGFSRVSWYTGMNEARIYYQDSYLLPDWREAGYWPAMVRQSEARLREIAESHPF